MPSDVRHAIEGGWRELAAIDEALERGELERSGLGNRGRLRHQPHGLEISPELAALARRRLPRWADRIFVGNAREWNAGRRFDFVRTGLDYVPPTRRRELVEHLLEHVVAPGGRLIVGVFNEEKRDRRTEERVASWVFEIAGRIDAEHRDPRVANRAFWIDGEGSPPA